MSDTVRDVETSGATPPTGRTDDATLVLNDLSANWRWSAALTFLAGTLMVALSYFAPYQFKSRASFVPEQTSQSTRADGLLGLASQLGVGVASSATSPQLYAELIRSV